MNRPARKLAHLREKIASKEALTQKIHAKKPGTRTKRWRKWAKQYEPLVASS